MYFKKFKKKKYEIPEPGKEYADLIYSVERENDLPENLLARLLQQESYFNPWAENKYSGAQGIAQIVPRWHPDVKDPFDPGEAIKYAGKYLRLLHDNFHHWDLTLAAYNWGWGNLRKHIAQYGILGFSKMPRETRNYVTEILNDI